MAIEIERKFLVADETWRTSAQPGVSMQQGYFKGDDKCSIRMRLAGERAWLTIKSATAGVRRSEFEYSIPADDAQTMLVNFCIQPLIEKTRYCVPHAGHVWEVDVFAGVNHGLMLAEIEIEHADARFDYPPWLGREVTDEARFYNAALAQHPFSHWSK